MTWHIRRALEFGEGLSDTLDPNMTWTANELDGAEFLVQTDHDLGVGFHTVDGRVAWLQSIDLVGNDDEPNVLVLTPPADTDHAPALVQLVGTIVEHYVDTHAPMLGTTDFEHPYQVQWVSHDQVLLTDADGVHVRLVLELGTLVAMKQTGHTGQNPMVAAAGDGDANVVAHVVVGWLCAPRTKSALQRATNALADYLVDDGAPGERGTALIDLVADLMLYAEHHHVDWQTVHRIAGDHATAESEDGQ